MKLSQLLSGIRVLESTADLDADVQGVSYDSRNTRRGDLFIAIRGYQTDGHRFIPAAAEQGAQAVVCEERPRGAIPYVLVESTRVALAGISANYFGHPAEKLQIIGVTGTNGKTTVTYLLKTVLACALGAKVGLIGTIWNQIGDEVLPTAHTTPESFELHALFRRMLDAGCTHVVIEASSHALYLRRTAGIAFDVGIFTNLTEDHLDFHKTMAAYREAKSILFQHCRVGVFNLDDTASERMIRESACQVITYSERRNDADVVAKNVRLKSDAVEMDVVTGNDISRCVLGIPGGFTVYNALAVIGAALALGVSLSKAVDALRMAKGVKGRVEVVPTPGKDYTILIDYAHTPDGLRNVLESVQGYCRGRVIAVFGCGGDRDPYKRPIMGKIGVETADYVVFTSDNPRTENPDEILAQVVAGARNTKTPYTVIENRRAAIRYAMDLARADDIIVLAGKGHETYQIIGTEKTHLDEREEVAAHLAGK